MEYQSLKIYNDISGIRIRTEFNLKNKIVLGMSSWFHKERKGFDILLKRSVIWMIFFYC